MNVAKAAGNIHKPFDMRPTHPEARPAVERRGVGSQALSNLNYSNISLNDRPQWDNWSRAIARHSMASVARCINGHTAIACAI